MKKKILLILLTLFFLGGAIANEVSCAPQEPEELAPGYYKTDTYQGQGLKLANSHLWWAPVNVGYTEDNPYGLLFSQRSTSEDGIVPLDNYAPGTPPSYERDNRWGMSAQGPCPDGWRVPTNIEWNFLLKRAISPRDSTRTPGQWQQGERNNFILTGQKTTPTPSVITGRWFGPDCKTATDSIPGNAIFLPAAGHFDSFQDRFFEKNGTGSYWSASVGEAFLFNGNSAHRINNRSYLKYGLSVRCVQGGLSIFSK